MSIIGPVSFKPGVAPATDYGDYIQSIQRVTPNPITEVCINRDFSGVPRSGHALNVTGVEEDLSDGTLWRYLWDHAGETDVPLEWSTASDGPVKFTGIIAVVPDPSQGGQANQHGKFTIPIPLTERPTLVTTP